MTKKYSVLVVDDQENWRELLVELLEDEFEVISVDNYDAALEKLRERKTPFYVIVTDLRLVDEQSGNEDGLKLAQEINHKKVATNVIVLTGYSTVLSTKRAFKELDVFDYLEKRPSDGSPFDRDGFLNTVRKAAEQTLRHDIFVIMPFAEKYNDFFEIIEKAAQENEATVERTDKTISSKRIMPRITDGIKQARKVTAYIPDDDENLNVYFEIGMSHAWRKEVLVVSPYPEALGMMLTDWPIISYDSTWSKGEELRKALGKFLASSSDDDLDDRSIETLRESVVIVAPDDTSDIYVTVIKPVLDSLGITPVHVWQDISADQAHENLLPPTIEDRVKSTSLVIAGLGKTNGDSFFLAGFTYILEKKTHILISQRCS